MSYNIKWKKTHNKIKHRSVEHQWDRSVPHGKCGGDRTESRLTSHIRRCCSNSLGTREWTILGRVGASLVAQMVKNLPALQETWLRSLGGEDPLEEGMATHSSNLAWEIPRTEEPGGLQSMGSQRVRHDWGHIHETWVYPEYLFRVTLKFN